MGNEETASQVMTQAAGQPRIRLRAYEILTVSKTASTTSRVFNAFLLALIALNVLAVIVESVSSIQSAYREYFAAFEIFSVSVFLIEYFLRLWSCVEDPAYQSPIGGRISFAVTPLAVVDLLAILPFFLAFITLDLRVIRILRIFRLMRVAKVARYSRALQIFTRVIDRAKTELLFTLFVMLVLLVLSACLMYFAENHAQPEVFSSIPATMWWAIATLTTVGYGDVYPITATGKVLASFIAIFGIGMFALPTGVLGASFLEVIRAEKTAQCCPHCGRAIEHKCEGESQ
jgi:voltage-gated potassium channel